MAKPSRIENNVEDIDKTEKPVTENTIKESDNISAPKEVRTKTYIYVGPSLPNGELKENSVFKNTSIENLKEYLKDIILKQPSVLKLMIPVDKFSEVSQKIKTTGNILNKYYNDILGEIKKIK